MGFWKARFYFDALSKKELDNPKTINDITKCKNVVINDSAKSWFLNNKDSLLEKVQTAKTKFGKEKNPGSLTLAPADGITKLY